MAGWAPGANFTRCTLMIYFPHAGRACMMNFKNCSGVPPILGYTEIFQIFWLRFHLRFLITRNPKKRTKNNGKKYLCCDKPQKEPEDSSRKFYLDIYIRSFCLFCHFRISFSRRTLIIAKTSALIRRIKGDQSLYFI